MTNLLGFKNPFKGLLKKDTSSRQVEVFGNSRVNQRVFIKDKDGITIKDYELICGEIQKDKDGRAITFVGKDSHSRKIFYVEDLLEKVELENVYDVNEQLVNGELKLVYTGWKKGSKYIDRLYVGGKEQFSTLGTIKDFTLSESNNDYAISTQRSNKNSDIYLNGKLIDTDESPIDEMNVSKDFKKVLGIFKDDEDQIFTIKLNGELIEEHDYISDVQFNEKGDHYAYVGKDEYDGIYIDGKLWQNIGYGREVHDMVLSPDGKSAAYSVRNKQTGEFSLISGNKTIDNDFNGSEFGFSPNGKIWFNKSKELERDELNINGLSFIGVKSNRDIIFSPSGDNFSFISVMDNDKVFLTINGIQLPQYTDLDLVIEGISDNNIISYKMYSEYFTNEEGKIEERALEKPISGELQIVNSNNEMIILIDKSTPNIFKYVKIDNIGGGIYESKTEDWLNGEFQSDGKYVIMNGKKYLRSILKI